MLSRRSPKRGRRTLTWTLFFLFIGTAFGTFYVLSRTDTAPTHSDTTTLSTTSDTTSTIEEPTPTNTVESKKAAVASTKKLGTVVTIAQKLPNTSQFNTLFKSMGLASELTDKGPYTVLVPTNGAFSQLPPGTLSRMSDEQKLRFIQYHVIKGRAIDPEAQTAGTIQALSGDALNFSFGADQIPLVNSAIFIEKYQASNGVVYLIDNVLLPPQR